MRADARASARRNLDKRLTLLPNKDALARPPGGWVRAIREALGMTTAQTITLDTLERAARALDCTLVYALVPRKPLETVVQERARERALERLRTISHSMALEDQRVAEEDERGQLEQLAQKLIDGPGSALWG
jgi:hydroxypyruvate isomerase